MSTAILFLRWFPHLHPSLPLTNLTSSFYRLLSAAAATTQSPPPNPHFAAIDYLIQSYGLPSDEAIRASKRIQHLQTPDKPDAVLRFLRQIGISESDIRTAVSRYPCLLCSHVEKNWRSNVAKLQEIGLSIEDISGNRLIGLRPEAMKVMVKRAEELGFSCSSQLFVYALITVSSLNKSTLNSRVHYLKSMGLSQEEVTYVISTAPTVLRISEKLLGRKMEFLKSMGLSQEEVTHIMSKAPMVFKLSEELLGRKMEFLMKEAGCGKIDVVCNPTLLAYQMEKRLIPRSVVRQLLMSKGHPVANKAFVSFMKPSEKDFLEKFILPFEHDIPGLGQAYAGKTEANK